MRNLFLKAFLLLIITTSASLSAQYFHNTFTKYDTLRGSLGPYRSNYDVLSYELDLQVLIERKEISGSNILNLNV